MPQKSVSRSTANRQQGVRLVGVIDVGATSLRMAIAQIDARGTVKTIETLRQAVNLGKDSFTRGRIDTETTESCVAALKSFRQCLRGYQITHPGRIRAVATSAVREALNRDAFLDRLYIGSGINVEVIDEAEVNRYTYLSVKALVEASPELKRRGVLVVEVGGGSTEFFLVRAGKVAFSQSLRLGSLRMREALEDFRAPAARLPALLENQIRTSLDQIRQQISVGEGTSLLAIGGDTRFAVSQITGEEEWSGVVPVPVSALADLTGEILGFSVDDLVRRFHLSYPDAESLGPALLTYTRVAQAFGLKEILVGKATLRDGLLAEMARESWTEEFTNQVIHSAEELARRYNCDLEHGRYVMKLARQIFSAMREEHQLAPRYGLILVVAALLHEIGLFISNRSHHKHSMYVIQHSALFGLGTRDMMLAALVARYHRRAVPKPTHEGYPSLDREGRIAVSKLAAILRVADALDQAHRQRIKDIDFTIKPGRLIITARHVADLTIERLGLQQKGDMFETVYGLKVVLRAGSARE